MLCLPLTIATIYYLHLIFAGSRTEYDISERIKRKTERNVNELPQSKVKQKLNFTVCFFLKICL